MFFKQPWIVGRNISAQHAIVKHLLCFHNFRSNHDDHYTEQPQDL